jgi:hypothetical protein
MVFTQATQSGTNKPGISVGTTGVDWSPDRGGDNYVST